MLNFWPEESVLYEAADSSQAQPELVCFSGTWQIDDLPPLSSSHTNASPAPPAVLTNHSVILFFAISSRLSSLG